MSDLDYARAEMGVSLAFHIVFAAIGVALPALMVVAEILWLRTGDESWRRLARMWARGTAILFAVGAMSGTVLSFELGLLWPKFMAAAGAVIGFPFAMEGFAFFTEAIFLGIYLYGWEKVGPRLHVFAGVIVATSGAVSAVFVTMANAWMNHPAGLAADGSFSLDPVAAMASPGWLAQSIHVLISSYQATAFAIAGVHAALLLSGKRTSVHRHALALSLTVGGICAFLQPISGDFSARSVHAKQPVKLAAMEGQFETEKGAPLRIGGIPDVDARVTRGAIEIPRGLSFLATHDPNAEIRGLNAFPRSDWPDVRMVHVSFQIMIAAALAMQAVAALSAILWWRGGRVFPESRALLRLVAFSTPLGMIALEAGWMVTERGRQPWMIQGVMRVRDAVTPMPGLARPFFVICAVYLALAIATTLLLRWEILHEDAQVGPH